MKEIRYSLENIPYWKEYLAKGYKINLLYKKLTLYPAVLKVIK